MELRSRTSLVEGIRAGEPGALEEFYRLLRQRMWRRVDGQDADDHLHDIYLIVTAAIQRGELREPDRLMGYVRTVARRQAAGWTAHKVQARAMLIPGAMGRDPGPDPEAQAIEKQRQEIAAHILQAMPGRDREILSRFYLQGQDWITICRRMRFTSTQFRLIKSRAKARYTELVSRRLAA